jgi:DNA (cytosine-5)-methyltransferase 1
MPADLLHESEPDFAENHMGLILPRDIVEEQIRKARLPTCVDLCCGAGGFSLGMMQAGFHVVAGVDHDPDCAVTYTMNLGAYPLQFHFVADSDRARLEKRLSKKFTKNKRIEEFATTGSGWIASNPGVPGVGHFFLGDMRKLTGRDILDAVGLEVGELDCVVGGPPCQGFSHGGKRQVMDPRNSLVFEFARLVVEMHPKSMVFENVPGIASMVTPDGIPVIDAFARILEDGGFAGYEAFKNSLKAQHPKAFGLMRSNHKAAKDKARVEAECDRSRATTQQNGDLFGDAGI